MNKRGDISSARREYLKKQKTNKIIITSVRILILVLFFSISPLFEDLGVITFFFFLSPF